ncbi:tRNA (adenosine(37)-N6)-dimethylallyltransferase MiaA [Candidatus Gottesmanbacteria bacterium]|nr:tRNA (adenosine(37)-N6)-dimethylallyltransferase MiaA [Candidatus Gottesmanbacteria bacterium]
MNKILIICGPTATGKTALALSLAKQFDGELISADSRQIYRGLDTITGKDIPKDAKMEQRGQARVYIIKGIPLWMYDAVEMDEEFSVSRYRNLALPIISDIHRRQKLPIIVGGTGLYIDALVKRFDTFAIPPDLRLRQTLNMLSPGDLQKKLARTDHPKWKRLNESDRNNPRRLVRAIEVALWKDKHTPVEQGKARSFDALWIGLAMPIAKLVQKIRERVNYRWEHGAAEEGKNFFHTSGSWQHPSTSAICLEEIHAFCSGTMSKNEAKAHWASREIAYAKRQMTWFKKKKDICWFDVSDARYRRSVTLKVAP